ncbi:spore coat protein [Brevibacillus migulae]|uniref:spore coat protein n=1 Tax=Brevibacillus migulae TaxID=1644114 RepID=UPI00106EF867|nr:spore coat protein [Brevibacillus migulae]
MNSLVEYLTGMDTLTDQVVAMDLLISAKSAVRNYALAVTEAVTPEIKDTLIKHLEEAIDMHERVISYMMERGLYKPWEVSEQSQMDLQNMNTAANAPLL